MAPLYLTLFTKSRWANAQPTNLHAELSHDKQYVEKQAFH